MMKAISIAGFGGIDVFGETEHPMPECAPNQVLVEVHAASVNPVDANIRAGLLQKVFPVKTFPHILGIDIAGVVTKLGEDVKHLREGDGVFGLTTSGAYAQFAIGNANEIAKIPDGISFAQAAALPAVALTALHSLFHYGDLQSGEKVLIHAGAGGVGHVAVQMAKLAGAYVVATASGENKAFLQELNADEVIDYTTTDFAQKTSDIDLILDSVVGEDQQRNVKVLKAGGRIVSIVHPDIAEQLAPQNVKAMFVKVNTKREDLEKIALWLRENNLRAFVNQLLPFSSEGLQRAHQRIETKRARGKLVIQLKDSI